MDYTTPAISMAFFIAYPFSVLLKSVAALGLLFGTLLLNLVQYGTFGLWWPIHVLGKFRVKHTALTGP